jgi:Replication-relaxation
MKPGDKQAKEPTELQGSLLISTYNLHYLTVPQMAMLHYKTVNKNTLNYVAGLLRTLDEEHLGYVQRGYLGRSVRFARNPSVFRLSRKGLNHVKSLDFSPLPKFRPGDPFPSYDKLAHTLEVNNVIIAGLRLAKFTPGIAVAQYMHDWILRHNPIYVTTAKKAEGKIAVIPDTWIDFRITLPNLLKAVRLPIHLELDMGTITFSEPFKMKLRALLAYIDGPYQERFGTQLITITFAVAGPLKRRLLRLEVIRAWCEQVLQEQKRLEVASLFYFCALPDGPLDPVGLFLKPYWITPFDDTLKTLLDPNG